MDWLETKIAAMVAEIAEIDEAIIMPSGTLKEIGVDSLMSVEIAVWIEHEFGVNFTDDDLGAVRTFNDLVSFTRSKLILV